MPQTIKLEYNISRCRPLGKPVQPRLDKLPKHSHINSVFTCLLISDFVSLIYLDKAFTYRFHSDVNEDNDITCSNWTTSNTRTVAFTVPSNAPALIQKFVGTGRISVVDQQRIMVSSDNSKITIESNPVPQISMASSFSTIATIQISSLPSDPNSSIIQVCVTCSASVFGVSGTIESYMLQEAQTSTAQFLEYCKSYIDELNELGIFNERLESIAKAGIAPPIEEHEEDERYQPGDNQESLEDTFFDANEISLTEIMAADADTTGLLLCVQFLCRRAEATESLLKSIDSRLTSLENAHRHQLQQQQKQQQNETETRLNKLENGVWSSSRTMTWVTIAASVTAVASVTLLWSSKRHH